MEEQQEEKASEEEETQEESGVLTEAKLVADRIEKANQTTAELLKRQEELAIKGLLGGKTEVGEQEKKEETPAEYAHRMTNGTRKE